MHYRFLWNRKMMYRSISTIYMQCTSVQAASHCGYYSLLLYNTCTLWLCQVFKLLSLLIALCHGLIRGAARFKQFMRTASHESCTATTCVPFLFTECSFRIRKQGSHEKLFVRNSNENAEAVFQRQSFAWYNGRSLPSQNYRSAVLWDVKLSS